MYGGYYGYGMGYDPTYLLVLIGVILTMAASAKVKSTYSYYSKVRSAAGITGAEAATRILQSQGIYDVSVCHVSGNLTDHYNPSTKVLNLSDSVYDSSSVAAIGVAAHECGHAMQHAYGYYPLQLRSMFVPVANFGATLSWPMILLGLMFGGSAFINLGILFFSLAVGFQLITLPVEFNASGRALEVLDDMGLLSQTELSHTRKVLQAAALTYVAAAASSLLQLLRLIILFGGNRRRD